MDKKKNRADPLAAGRQKLQQFRQKKADKGTDQKKDSKGSTSQGKSSKKSGKSVKHEPKPDTSSISVEAETLSNVAAGEITSHVNIGEEVVGSPQTSANALYQESVSVHGSSSEPDTHQPGNTTTTSDSGAELGKQLVNSENDISISLSSEEETMKSVDSGAAGTVDSLTPDPPDSDKGVTQDDASINVDGIFIAAGNLAEGEGVEGESGSGIVEKQHQPSSLHEFIPDVSLVRARGDQVTDVGEMQEGDGSHKEQFSESSAKVDVDRIAAEERQTSYPAIVDPSAPLFPEESSVAFDSVEVEGMSSKIGGQQIREAAELNVGKPETSIGFHDNRDHVLSAEPEESCVADVASHEEPRKVDTMKPSGEVSAAHIHEGQPVSFLQLINIVQGLGEDEYKVLCNLRETASSTEPGTSSLERLREELFVSSTKENILHMQLSEQSHLQNEFDHQHNQFIAEISQLRASYTAVTERNDSLVEELSECQSKLYVATSLNEKLESQLLATEADTAKMNELQLTLERSLLDLSECQSKLNVATSLNEKLESQLLATEADNAKMNELQLTLERSVLDLSECQSKLYVATSSNEKLDSQLLATEADTAKMNELQLNLERSLLDLSECQSKLYIATSSNEKLESQLLASEADTAKMNELQLTLERSLLDLSEAKEKFINLQVENETLVAIISSVNDEKHELLGEKESKAYEIKHLSSELFDCKNLVAALKVEVEQLEKTIDPLTDEKRYLLEEKCKLLGEAEKLQEDLANCKTSVTLQEVENSNIRETLSLLTGQQAKLEEEFLLLTEENENAHLELSAHLISETYLLSEYSNLKEGYTLLNNKLLKFQEEKEHLVEDNDKLTHELLTLQERMSTVQEERTHLAVELGEAKARLDKLAWENTSPSSSIEVEKAKMVGINNDDAPGLINKEMCENLGRSLEAGLTSKQSAPYLENTCLSPGSQHINSEEVMDDASEFSALNKNLEKGEKMVQDLEEAIKQILSESTSTKSINKPAVPAVSKLIQAFESKGQQEEHESEKAQLTGDQPDEFVSVNVQIRNLRGLLKQLGLNARKAGMQSKTLNDDWTATNQRLKEFNVEFASHQDHINLLEADTIENKISFEALKNYSFELQHKNHELELLCESLKLRNDSISVENTELNMKMNSCLSRIVELEIQLESLQQNSSSILSSMEEQLVALQDESERASIVEHELTSSMSEFGEAVARLDDCLLRSGTSRAHAGLDMTKSISGSVDVAVKVINDLEEKLETAYATHESTSNRYEELKQNFNNLLEKNEFVTASMHKVYADLTKLITESYGSVEMPSLEIGPLDASDPFKEGSCENLMEAMRSILSERLELRSVIDKLQSDLSSKSNDMEELTQRSVDSTSLQALVGKVEGVLELESSGSSFDSPSSYVEFLVSQLVQKFIETEELADLTRKQVEAKENELIEIQESLLHHQTELGDLRENLIRAQDSLVAAQSELQKKANELEQSEQRLSSTREKLSIAVAKGKGLIGQRDNLKQSLAETSAELQRCSEELHLKDSRVVEVEAKLKTYMEAGERVEALESELSYIRNSATALRESFLLKDSLLHRIEEILENLDLPEHFHPRDIIETVEWLVRSASGNSLRPSDWDQKTSDGGAGFVLSDPWREDVQTGTSSEDDLRIKFEELKGKFYGLAEQNEMLEQSLMERNTLVQRWEELLENIDIPPQLQPMEVENKIEWLASTISEATHGRGTLQQKIDNLEEYCQSLSADLEVSQKQVCDVEANLQSVVNEKVNLSERLESLTVDRESVITRTSHLEAEIEILQNQVKDLQEKLVEKLGIEEHLQTIEGELSGLRYTINDILLEDGLQDLALASNSETLDGLLRKLIGYYKNLVKSSLSPERDDDSGETGPSSAADVRSRGSLGTDEATSHVHQPELADSSLVEATSRDIAVVETPDVASLTKDLEDALHVQKLTREERDLYMEKQQSLVAEIEALNKKILELEELLKQEEQKSASGREKLVVAVRKGKALVQQKDSLKQTIEEMNVELCRLKSEITNRDEMLLENEKKLRESESYTVRVEALESECQLLKNHLQETENILQERSGILSTTLNALNSIDIGDEGDRNEPVLKLQQISQLFQNMSTAVSSAEQESRKSRRAAELLLAELNEVQERNDSLQEELSRFTYEVQQLSRQKDAAEAAKVEAISRFENLSVADSEEKKKLYSQLLSIGTSVNTLRKILAGTNSCLADIFTMDMEFLHHLKANMESCAKQTGTNLSGWPQLSTENFADKEIFSSLSAAWSNVNLHNISSGGNITEICGSLSLNLDQFVADVSHLEEYVSKHLASWHEQVNIVSNCVDMFFKSIGTGTDSEIASLGERIALLHGACSSVLVEIERRKAELVGNNNFNASLHQVEEDSSSVESVKSMVNRLSSAVKELVVANAETVERNEKEMKVIIANLQRELHEKDIQNERMCNELVGQVREAQAGAKIFAEDLQSASSRMREMQDQLAIMVQERDSMKESVKELQEGHASHLKSQEKVTSLGDLLAAKDQEIEALMQALDEEESQMEDLKHRVQELEQEVQQKNLDLKKAEASRGKISKKLSSTVDKFDELHHLSETLLAEIEKLQQQVQDRDTEVSFLRQEVTRCTNEALVASQMGTKRDSEEIRTVLSWFDTIASLVGLEDSPSSDAQSHANQYMETLEKRITSMLSEMDELRLVGQSKDSLLEAERSRVAELRQKEATLEKIIHEKESQPNMPMSSTSEIVEVEPLINKRTMSGTIPSQVRSLRKGNNDQVAIRIDADQADESRSLEEDDDKAHGFRSLSTSRIVPRFTRPVTNMIDGLWVSCDRTLMRQPALRLGIMIYWAILHALLATFVV